MTVPDPCPECGAPQVLQDVRVADTLEEELGAEVHENPGAMLLEGTSRVPLQVRVCGACGSTELYATDPAKLLQAREQGGSPDGERRPQPGRVEDFNHSSLHDPMGEGNRHPGGSGLVPDRGMDCTGLSGWGRSREDGVVEAASSESNRVKG